MRWIVPVIAVQALMPAAWAQFMLGNRDIGASVRIPSVGRTVTYTVRLRAPMDQPLAGDYIVTLRTEARSITGRNVRLDLPAGQHQDVSLQWTPQADGWELLTFAVRPQAARSAAAEVRRTVPVTARPLYFLWFGAPQRFHWCNVPTTVKDEDRDWWLWRGAIPCAWKGGVCYKEWPVEKFIESYDASPWIAIDEVGALDETGQKIMAAVRAHKQAFPDGCRAIWFMGVHDYWRDFRDCVDLYVPEIYLNYRSNHLGQIDAFVQRTREVGCMDRTIPGLGINVILDGQKQPTVTPTKEDVLRQIRHLKTIAPELPGVGFFTSDSAAPGVAEYADELCREYYIEPVLTLVPDSLQAQVKGTKLELRATLRNCGGMTARNIELWFGRGYADLYRYKTSLKVTALAPDAEVTVTQQVPLQPGVHRYGVQLFRPQGTVLNAALWTMAARGLRQPGPVVWQNVSEGQDPPVFAAAPAGTEVNRAEQLSADGTAVSESAASVLPGLPDESAGVVTFVPVASGRVTPELFAQAWLPQSPTAFQLGKRRVAPERDITVERSDGTMTVAAPKYRAALDLAKDQITSLQWNGTELLGSPWAFNSTAYTGFQEAELEYTPAGLLVTIPFTNPQAEGFSRYFFYGDAPVIRLERWFAPRGEMTVTASSEGCQMPQRGGVFALQGGVGGPVVRGQLHDSKDYRDLLFGYLGDGPRPENARLAGWFDCSFPDLGGLGVAIERRWEAAHSDVGYDVTRYYDGGDSLAVMNLWGKGMQVAQPQGMILYLVPHGPMALDQPEVTPEAQRLWENVHERARPVVR